MDKGKVRERFGCMDRFKVGLRCKGMLSGVIIDVITCKCLNINMYEHNTCIVSNY